MFELLTSIFILSASHGVDPYLVAAVVQTESKFNTRAVGGVGEIGLMQLRPEYFASSKGGKELFRPEVNLDRGIAYLKTVKESCIHKAEHTFLVCYNTGIAGGAKIKYPRKFDYYKRVTQEYKKFKSAQLFKPIQVKLIAKSWTFESNPRGYVLSERTSLDNSTSMLLQVGFDFNSQTLLVFSERRHRFDNLTWKSLRKFFRIFT